MASIIYNNNRSCRERQEAIILFIASTLSISSKSKSMILFMVSWRRHALRRMVLKKADISYYRNASKWSVPTTIASINDIGRSWAWRSSRANDTLFYGLLATRDNIVAYSSVWGYLKASRRWRNILSSITQNMRIENKISSCQWHHIACYLAANDEIEPSSASAAKCHYDFDALFKRAYLPPAGFLKYGHQWYWFLASNRHRLHSPVINAQMLASRWVATTEATRKYSIVLSAKYVTSLDRLTTWA